MNTREKNPASIRTNKHLENEHAINPGQGKISTQLIPVTSWNTFHAWPPIGGLRHLIFHEKSNGFSKVIRRVGRRVLIDEQAFFDWVDQQGASK